MKKRKHKKKKKKIYPYQQFKTHYNLKTLKEKEEIVAHYREHGFTATFTKYKISRATLSYWAKRASQPVPEGVNPLARRPKRHTILKQTEDLVKELHKKHPTWSLNRVREEVLKAKIQSISQTTIWKIIHGKNYPPQRIH